jgi:protein O-mannosyl-transferase
LAGKRKDRRAPSAQRPHDKVANAETETSSAKQARRAKAVESAQLRNRKWLLLACVVIATVFAYAASLDGQFVYDDQFQILKNPTINSLANVPRMLTQSVWQFMNASNNVPVGLYYRPLFNIVLILNYHLFGTSVGGWHFFSLLLHIGVTLLVFALARQWQLSEAGAVAAALIFGVHPIHVESVAWISAFPDPLAALLVLASLLLYERYYRVSQKWDWRAGLMIAFAFFALLTKEVAIALPVFLMLRETFEAAEGESLGARLVRAGKRTIWFFVAAVGYLVLRFFVLGFVSKPDPKAAAITASQVLLTIPSVLVAYARMLVVPYPLAITYSNSYISSAADIRFWGSALLIAGLTALLIWLVRSSRPGQLALLFLGVFLLPVLNLRNFNQNESLIHDRYLYLPSVGFCILGALALSGLSSVFAARRKLVFQTATAVVALVFLVLSYSQSFTWQNDLAMIDAAMKVNPRSPFLYNYLGAYYSQRHDFGDAEPGLLKALEIDPAYYDSLSNLGDAYREQGKLEQAREAYLKAIEAGSVYADTYYNLGVVYTSLGRTADAEQPLRRAIELNPTNAEARYNLAWTYDNLGKLAEAEQTYRDTLGVKPSYPEPRINLGILLTKLGRYQEALDQLQTAGTYAPGHPVLLYGLGDVYSKLGRNSDAIAAFNQLIGREPRHPLAHTSLGLAYEAAGNTEQARASFQKAVEVAPKEKYTDVAREHLAKLQEKS